MRVPATSCRLRKWAYAFDGPLAFEHELSLELSDRPEHVEHQAASWSGSVYRLVEDLQRHALRRREHQVRRQLKPDPLGLYEFV